MRERECVCVRSTFRRLSSLPKTRHLSAKSPSKGAGDRDTRKVIRMTEISSWMRKKFSSCRQQCVSGPARSYRAWHVYLNVYRVRSIVNGLCQCNVLRKTLFVCFIICAWLFVYSFGLFLVSLTFHTLCFHKLITPIAKKGERKLKAPFPLLKDFCYPIPSTLGYFFLSKLLFCYSHLDIYETVSDNIFTASQSLRRDRSHTLVHFF